MHESVLLMGNYTYRVAIANALSRFVIIYATFLPLQFAGKS